MYGPVPTPDKLEWKLFIIDFCVSIAEYTYFRKLRQGNIEEVSMPYKIEKILIMSITYMLRMIKEMQVGPISLQSH